MNVSEIGQDWKIAALRTNIHVHFLFMVMFMENKFMDLAFEQANKAFLNNEVPIGAIIVKDGVIVSVGYNRKESSNSVFAHAEIIAIYEAEKKLNNWRLNDCDLYVTLDPCPMCASAIKQSRIRNVFSALEKSDVNNGLIINKIFKADTTNPSVNFYTNLYVDKAKKNMNSFFEKQRKK